VWLFTSGVVVVFIGGLLLLSQQPDDGASGDLTLPNLSALIPEASDRATATQPAERPAPNEETTISRRAQLEFYTLLQQTDVLVPDEILALRQRAVIQESEQSQSDTNQRDVPTSPASIDASPGQFVIQVASFSKESDADNLRARLILEGMTRAHVTQADLGERGIFHRVMIGPVISNRETQTIADRLDNLGLQGLVRNHTPD
ncbi:MAG: SPOR domain-containing protein, partial [Natronospirillum sp.]